MSSSDSFLFFTISAVVYVIVMILAILVGYLLMKAAVKNGTLQAMRQAKQEGLIHER